MQGQGPVQVKFVHLIGLFPEEVHDHIQSLLFQGNEEKVAGLVVFENPDMSSSHRGERTGVAYGPGCDYKTLAEVWWRDEEASEINVYNPEGLASTQKLPVCYYEKDPADDSNQSPDSAA